MKSFSLSFIIFISSVLATSFLENSFSCYKQVNEGHCLLQGLEKSRCRKSGHGFSHHCEDNLTLCKACHTRRIFSSRAPLLKAIEDWCIPQGGFIAEFNSSCTNFCAQTPTQ